MESTAALTATAVLVAVVALAAAAWAGRGRPVGRMSLVAAAGAGGVASAVTVVLVRATATGYEGFTAFLVGHLVYLVAVVAVPLVGLGLAVLAWRRGPQPLVWLVVAASVVPAVGGAYATHVEPYRLRVDHHTVAIDPARAGDDPVRIGVLADIQTAGVGDHERRAVAEVMAARPDVVLLPGDLFQGDLTDADLDAMRSLLGELEAPGGVWFVRGDSDGGDGGPADRILDGLDIGVLVDEVVVLTVGDRTIRLGGTSLMYDDAAARDLKTDLEGTDDDGSIAILMSHRPDTVLGLASDSRVDLTVAGHTHGGQVVLPVVGPLVTLSSVPRDVARGGLHVLDGNALYVSPGVGVERGQAPQVRFLSRPAVAILTLTDG